MIQSVRDLTQACKKLVKLKDIKEEKEYNGEKWYRNCVTERKIKGEN